MSFSLILLIITSLISFIRGPVGKDGIFKMKMETQHTLIGTVKVKKATKEYKLLEKHEMKKKV